MQIFGLEFKPKYNSVPNNSTIRIYINIYSYSKLSLYNKHIGINKNILHIVRKKMTLNL